MTKHLCQYVHADGTLCRRTAYYLIPSKNLKDEYRCILDTPLRYRIGCFKIRRPKGDRPLHT